MVGPLVDVLANQVCRVNLNTQCQRGPDVFPFTGRKDSAEATLSVSDALRCFSIRSMVAAPGKDANRALLRDILNGRTSNFVNTDYLSERLRRSVGAERASMGPLWRREARMRRREFLGTASLGASVAGGRNRPRARRATPPRPTSSSSGRKGEGRRRARCCSPSSRTRTTFPLRGRHGGQLLDEGYRGTWSGCPTTT